MIFVYTRAVRPLRDVLFEPALRGRVEVLAGAIGEQRVERVTLVEDPDELKVALEGDVAVLTVRASELLEAYRLDGALRVAASRGVVALVLTSPAPAISLTSRDLAQKTATVIAGADATLPLAELVLALQHGIARGADAALQKLVAVWELVGAAAESERSLLERAAAALGTPIAELEESDSTDGLLSAPVVVDNMVERVLAIPAVGGAADLAGQIALQLVADAVARITASARDADEVPALSGAEVISEFLLTEEPLTAPLVRRARALGVPVDAWHVAIAVDTDNLSSLVEDDELRAFELREMLTREAFRVVDTSGGSWYRARVGTALLLFRSDHLDPGHRAPALVAREAARVLTRMAALVPGIVLSCGVGTSHAGPQGIRATAAEARTALRLARANRVTGAPVLFDPASVRRTLIEWYASDTAREAVRTLLAPLEKLGPKRRDTALETLQTYLDHAGSLSRTAEAMHLHRNAVAYRIKNIMKLLDVDPEEPDQRLMLHLACRAQLLR